MTRRCAAPARPRTLHAAVRACAGHGADHGAQEHFTVTTPLYYVNAGGRCWWGRPPPPLVDAACCRLQAALRCAPACPPLYPCTFASPAAAPHMGSAYPTIAADAIARYQRLRGRPVTFLTGTDEHGEKIALAAAARGLEPKAHCDDVVASYKALWKEVCCRAAAGGGLPPPLACHPPPAARCSPAAGYLPAVHALLPACGDACLAETTFCVWTPAPVHSWTLPTTRSSAPPTRGTRRWWPRCGGGTACRG